MTKGGVAYVLTSRHHGSNNQLVALAGCLGQFRTVKTVRCELRARNKVFYLLYRWLCREVVHHKAEIVPAWLKKILLRGDVPCLQEGDIIIAKTPPFEAPLLLLARGTGATTVFIGRPKRFPRQLFDCLISTPSTPVSPASVNLSMLPTSMSFSETVPFDDRDETVSENTSSVKPWCFFIGGEARGFSYSEEDWERLCFWLLSLAAKYEKKILLSTSPRTGTVAEGIIKKLLTNHENVQSVFLWGEKEKSEKSPMLEYIAASECLFVTEDSAAMISDALVSRRPVVSIRLYADSFNSLSTPLAIYHSERNHLLRMVIGDMDSVDVVSWQMENFRPLQQGWREEMISQLPI